MEEEEGPEDEEEEEEEIQGLQLQVRRLRYVAGARKLAVTTA